MALRRAARPGALRSAQLDGAAVDRVVRRGCAAARARAVRSIDGRKPSAAQRQAALPGPSQLIAQRAQLYPTLCLEPFGT